MKSKPKAVPESGSGGHSDSTFKKPTMSVLGLDRLARRKREEREAEAASFPEKKSRLQHFKEQSDHYDSNVKISFGKSSRSQDVARDRKYRGSLVETPTYTGGVDEEALQKIHSRLLERDQRSHGVYASTERQRGDRRDR